MRDIKFRLVYNGKVVGQEVHEYNKENNHISIFHNGFNIEAVEGAEVQHNHKDQFTGLKDKGGVEIYEGDIVKHQKVSGQYGGWWDGVITSKAEGSMGWCVEPLPKDKDRGRYGMNWSYTFEVIGNIHENRELLT